MRKTLKKLWDNIHSDVILSDTQMDRLEKDFETAQQKMSKSIKRLMQRKNGIANSSVYPNLINVNAKMSCKISPIGHINNLVYRLLISYAGHEKYLKSLPLSLYVEYKTPEA